MRERKVTVGDAGGLTFDAGMTAIVNRLKLSYIDLFFVQLLG